MSSSTPMTTIMSAAPRIANTGPGRSKTRLNQDTCEATANATRMPANMATPPSRGVGRVWTSRARMAG
ncbi:hypothetical protein CMMCAS02_06225 [Clavibacter michiganensis subsp. michiganensis]|nr:hypothetical protein CMMCAS02_06225 [Clavibacter michiganensis subsp. michiganensis]